MDSPIPEELKFINQFIQRSKELKTQEPIISYYCIKIYSFNYIGDLFIDFTRFML
jgi:hypothetical protein